MISSVDKFVESDDALMHYTPFEIGLEQILVNKKFRLSTYNKTNDPREYKYIIFNWDKSFESDDEKRLYGEVQSKLDSVLKFEYKVMCLCSNMSNEIIVDNSYESTNNAPSTKAWKKSRMWSQYGKDHRGLCLVFSKESIEKQLMQLGYNSTNSKSGLVSYTNSERFSYRTLTLNTNRLPSEGTEKYCRNHVRTNLENFFFTKNLDYRDESEYRYVIFEPEKEYIYFDIEPILKYVIIGDKTPKVYYPIIKELCSNLNIECRRITWDKGVPILLLANSKS